jgi:hypothetical protein
VPNLAISSLLRATEVVYQSSLTDYHLIQHLLLSLSIDLQLDQQLVMSLISLMVT